MALQQKGMHGAWVSRWTFIMAATGSAVGLGNMWKFPYVAGSNGGGAFVLVYLACILFIGVPVMMAEVMLGRHGRKSPVNAMRDIVAESSVNHRWLSRLAGCYCRYFNLKFLCGNRRLGPKLYY